MEFVKQLLVLFHLLGFAALAGGAMVQLRQSAPVFNRFIADGAWTQLLTGLVLVGVNEMGPDPVNHVKVGVKLLVLVVIVVVVLMHRRRDGVSPLALRGVFGLTVLNAAVAVLWQ